VLLAGGVADAADVRAALAAGAMGVVVGTRFVLSDESAAHPGYKQRLRDGDRTLVTDLFGFGWPARHRVIPNAATARWLRSDSRGPLPVRAVLPMSGALGRRLPMSVGARIAAHARLAVPLYGPAAPLASSPERVLDTSPLYAGETVVRITDIRPAGDLVRALAGET
jgi:NAD(P)H-dependent flavin oxidoreductase YrpB (nitropropane dioxygenase family)